MRNNPLYITYLKSDKWKKIRNAVVARDGNKCTKCSSTDNLHVHHLTYDRVGEEELTDLITLCKDCHEATHETVFSNSHKKIKSGFNMIYHKSYEEVLEEVIKSNKDVKYLIG
jgi:hypothetical protein